MPGPKDTVVSKKKKKAGWGWGGGAQFFPSWSLQSSGRTDIKQIITKKYLLQTVIQVIKQKYRAMRRKKTGELIYINGQKRFL